MKTVRSAASLLLLFIVIGCFSRMANAQTPTSNCSTAALSPTPQSGGNWPPPQNPFTCVESVVSIYNGTYTYAFTLTCQTNANTVNPPPNTNTSTTPETLSLTFGCDGFANGNCNPNWVTATPGAASQVPGNNWVWVQGLNNRAVNIAGIPNGFGVCSPSGYQGWTLTCAATACPCDDNPPLSLEQPANQSAPRGGRAKNGLGGPVQAWRDRPPAAIGDRRTPGVAPTADDPTNLPSTTGS